MSVRTWKEIVDTAKEVQKNVKNKQELGTYTQWGYYFACGVLNPGHEVKRIKTLKTAPAPTGNYISKQISKKKYLEMASYLKWFAEKKGRMRNYLEYKTQYSYKKISEKVYVKMLADIIVYYDKHGKLPADINVNSKAFIKPEETHNVVYQYFVDRTGRKPKTVDEVLEFMDGKGYGGYYDDQLSNRQVIDGLISTDYDLDANCVDSLQMVINMAEDMGYDWKCIHVECRTSGTGHVFGKFRHKTYTEGEWITRDPASVLSGNGVRSVWCSDGYVLAVNPDWFLENLNR